MVNAQAEASPTTRALDIVEAASGAAERCGRADLVERLGAASRRLHHAEVTVLVAGEFKQGKSSLVNAIVNAPVCPVDDDVATAVATVIRYAESSEATITYDPPVEEGEEPPDIAESITTRMGVVMPPGQSYLKVDMNSCNECGCQWGFVVFE